MLLLKLEMSYIDRVMIILKDFDFLVEDLFCFLGRLYVCYGQIFEFS